MVRTVRNATVALTGAQSDMISEAKFAVGKRVVLALNNLNAVGGNDVFVAFGMEGAANIGVRLSPGQSATWSMDGGYIPPQDRVNAYCAGAGSVAVYEEIEQVQ